MSTSLPGFSLPEEQYVFVYSSTGAALVHNAYRYMTAARVAGRLVKLKT